MILDIDQSMRFFQKKSLKTNLDDLQSQGSSIFAFALVARLFQGSAPTCPKKTLIMIHQISLAWNESRASIMNVLRKPCRLASIVLPPELDVEFQT